MDAMAKLQLLGPGASYEPAEEVGMTGERGAALPQISELAGCIYHAATPKGRVPLLKTLLTSACERDCTYCPFRAGRDFQRATFAPDELARLTWTLHHKGLIKGVFLSSGVAGGGPRTQERLIAAAKLLRGKYGFRGYIHLKIMPGAEREQVAEAMRLADRVSLNLEAPNDARLTQLAPHKIFMEELLQRLQWVQELRQEHPGLPWPSSTTQFVVGAAGESDRELLTTTEYLHQQLRLARAYFSSFSPVSDTPLAHRPPAPPERERRLYQAAFLLRDYGFTAAELPFGAEDNLPTNQDPKLLWAQQHLADTPLELNQADRMQLLRVPGIGPKGAEKVLAARRQGQLRELGDLRKLGIVSGRAAPFILLDGKAPAQQLRLWVV